MGVAWAGKEGAAPVIGVVVPHVEGYIPGVDDGHLQVGQPHVGQLVAPAPTHNILPQHANPYTSQTMSRKGMLACLKYPEVMMMCPQPQKIRHPTTVSHPAG